MDLVHRQVIMEYLTKGSIQQLTQMIVEDILTTGGQVLEAAETLKESGAKIDRIVAVIDRMEGARQNIESAGFVLESLFTTSDLGIAPA